MEANPKPAAATPSATRRRVVGHVHDDAVRLMVREGLLDLVLDYSEKDTTRELGGLLLGSFVEGDHPRVELRNFVPFEDARSHAASLTITHESWSVMTREIGHRFPDDQVVGWHHTHPNLGVFLSGYDLFIHRHFFSEVWQVALVVDPIRQEFGFFQWRGDSVVDCGFAFMP
jgi:proteasome lid subunit RPN8/RPN11